MGCLLCFTAVTLLYCSMQQLYFNTQGQGETLVLVHGFCEDSRIWAAIAPALQAKHRVVLVDMAGFGKSPLDSSKEQESVDDMADRLAHTLQQNDIQKCCLVGHSMGGYVTLAFAQKYPDMLTGWGLFHSSASADTDEKKESRLKQAEFVGENGTEPFVKVLIPSLFAPSQNYAAQMESALAMAKECTPFGIMNALLAMRQRPERVEVLKTSKVPVLIIAGAEDGVIPVEKLSYQASLPQRCQLELFEKSGHMGMLEEPQKSIDVLSRFMAFCNDNGA